jgi:hypothetical protein
MRGGALAVSGRAGREREHWAAPARCWGSEGCRLRALPWPRRCPACSFVYSLWLLPRRCPACSFVYSLSLLPRRCPACSFVHSLWVLPTPVARATRLSLYFEVWLRY